MKKKMRKSEVQKLRKLSGEISSLTDETSAVTEQIDRISDAFGSIVRKEEKKMSPRMKGFVAGIRKAISKADSAVFEIDDEIDCLVSEINEKLDPQDEDGDETTTIRHRRWRLG